MYLTFGITEADAKETVTSDLSGDWICSIACSHRIQLSIVLMDLDY